MTKSSVQLRKITLILGLAIGTSACSTISDLDPTGLLSDSSDNAPASQFPDQATPTASDQTVGTTPDLASLPARPAPSATPADQQQTTQSLASDGAQARYSADALRGGTEAAAPAPAASEAAPTVAQRVLGVADAPPTASDAPPTAPPTAEPAAPAPAQMAAAPPPAAAPSSAAEPAPTAAPQMAAAPPALPAGAQPAVPANVPVQTAALPAASAAAPVGPSAGASVTPPGAQPAVPAVPAGTPLRNGVVVAGSAMSDAALGFKPSAAPPLDPSVRQFVSAPIVAQYRQTASIAGPSAVGTPAVPAVPPKGSHLASDDGAVVANLGSVSGGPGRLAMMNGGVPPTAVVYFPGDGVKLSKAAHAQVRAAVAAFKADGGQGVIRVVGHASSRTANMSVEKHLETIFAKSQARADAVAQELIHEGIPAGKVLIDAVGDSQPVYYESMPKGEDGNRRAEIFVQG